MANYSSLKHISLEYPFIYLKSPEFRQWGWGWSISSHWGEVRKEERKESLGSEEKQNTLWLFSVFLPCRLCE